MTAAAADLARATSLRRPVLGVAVVTGLVAVSAANGGYFPTAWCWLAVALLWVAATALLAGTVERLAGRELLLVGAWAALVAWVAATAAWSPAADAIAEAERDLAYGAAVLAAVLVVRRRTVPTVLGAALAATTAVAAYSLATRLLPDRLGSYDAVAAYRLSTPLGYWNALGMLTVLGIVLALGFVAGGKSAAGRLLAGAAVVPLATTLYFTYSRGAWVALAAGIGAVAVIGSRRFEWLTAVGACAPAPAAAVWFASRSHALTHEHAALRAAVHDGHRLALILLALSAAAAPAAAASRRVVGGDRVRRTVVGIAAVTAIVAVGVAAVPLVSHARHGFARRTSASAAGDLNHRLFSFSGTGRADLWRAAIDDFATHPVGGSGAGSFEARWLRERPVPRKVRDAHSLYLETAAELGAVGAALLAVLLAVPLVAIARTRRDPLVVAAFGAYVAFLVHAAVDWDWEVPAVVLPALACGVCVVIAARPDGAARLRRRTVWASATVVLAAVAFVPLAGNLALAQSAGAARSGDWTRSLARANRARAWVPWSSEPWRLRGEAQLALGREAEARASFARAIATSPRDWNLWFDLARASTGRTQAAALARARRLDPLGPEIAELEHELAAQGRIAVVGG